MGRHSNQYKAMVKKADLANQAQQRNRAATAVGAAAGAPPCGDSSSEIDDSTSQSSDEEQQDLLGHDQDNEQRPRRSMKGPVRFTPDKYGKHKGSFGSYGAAGSSSNSLKHKSNKKHSTKGPGKKRGRKPGSSFASRMQQPATATGTNQARQQQQHHQQLAMQTPAAALTQADLAAAVLGLELLQKYQGLVAQLSQLLGSLTPVTVHMQPQALLTQLSSIAGHTQQLGIMQRSLQDIMGTLQHMLPPELQQQAQQVVMQAYGADLHQQQQQQDQSSEEIQENEMP